MDGQNQMNPGMNQPVKPEESGVGPIIATIIILAVIVLGGLYFWNQRTSSMEDTNGTVPTTYGTDADTSAIDSQSNSDDTTSIQNDLNTTNTTSVDSGLNAS